MIKFVITIKEDKDGVTEVEAKCTSKRVMLSEASAADFIREAITQAVQRFTDAKGGVSCILPSDDPEKGEALKQQAKDELEQKLRNTLN